MPNVSALVTTTVLNTKTGQIGNNIPYISSLVTTAVPNTKIGKVEKKIRVMILNILLLLNSINLRVKYFMQN